MIVLNSRKFNFFLANFIIIFLYCLMGIHLISQSHGNELIFDEFKKHFMDRESPTELSHPITESLSQIYHEDPVAGLKLLHEVDQDVSKSITKIDSKKFEEIYNIIYDRLIKWGRLFIVGSGTSGRIAVDISQKCNELWQSSWVWIKEYQYSISANAVMVGGTSAFAQSKKDFEDSEQQGQIYLEECGVTKEDIVILISESGSTNFNVGAAKTAYGKEAAVLYLYNSQVVPIGSEELFDSKKIELSSFKSGAQAIQGSTRLQASTINYFILGNMLNMIYSKFMDNIDSSYKIFNNYNCQLKHINQLIEAQIEKIAAIAIVQKEIFSNPAANFLKRKDITSRGYVTLLGNLTTIHAIMTDATETASTFGLSSPYLTKEEKLKYAEYRAYLIGEYTNTEAWVQLCGHTLIGQDAHDAEEIITAYRAEGSGSYINRPRGLGNMLIGVLRSDATENEICVITSELKQAKEHGANTAFIGISIDENNAFGQICNYSDISILYEYEACNDPLNIMSTLLLKQTLNLISNGTMIGMNKVHGNMVTDFIQTH